MTRVLAVAVAALAAVALYATTAPAGQHAVTPKQFAALAKRVAKLEKDNKDLKDTQDAVYACVFDQGAIPVTKSPAFHVTGTGEAADFYTLTTSRKECVDFINSPLVRKQLHR